MMTDIIKVHYPDLEENLLQQALEAFYTLRGLSGLQKKPSTSELLDWIQALVLGGIIPDTVVRELPLLGVMIKKNEDFPKVQRYLDERDGRRPKPTY
jgi:MoxR-like ATPase